MICSDKLNWNSTAVLIQALKGSKLTAAASKGWQLPHGQPSLGFRRLCPFVLPSDCIADTQAQPFSGISWRETLGSVISRL